MTPGQVDREERDHRPAEGPGVVAGQDMALRAGLLVGRLCLGFLLLALGIDKIIDPSGWVTVFPTILADALDQGSSGSAYDWFWFLGLVEVIMGVQFLLGLLTRMTAVMAVLLFACSAVWSGLGRDSVVHLGLLGFALIFVVAGAGEWSLDEALWRLKQHQSRRGRPPIVKAASGIAVVLSRICLFVLFAMPETVSDEVAVPPPATSAVLTAVPRDEAIPPIPATLDLEPGKVDLGRRLFDDTALSGDGTISCATCHDLSRGGVDGLKTSVGVGGAISTLNAPTVFNAAFNFKQHWDGRAATLEEHVDGAVESQNELSNQWSRLLAVLRQRTDYARDFERLYDGGIGRKAVCSAVADYVRSLITPNSRFDRWLRGDTSALTEEEIAGYRRFSEVGCVSCHQGVNVGGNMFHTMGRMVYYFGRKDRVTQADMGRFNVTGKPEDRHRFKVPSLRNVALTAPYFHDGSAGTLSDAIRIMAECQLGIELSALDVDRIERFLNSLTGEVPLR